MKNIPCPVSVKTLAAAGFELLQTITTQNISSAETFLNISSSYMASNHFALPTAWKNDTQWLTSGGNILCSDFEKPPSLNQGALTYTGRFTTCGGFVTAQFLPAKSKVIIAATVANLNAENLGAVCDHHTSQTCQSAFVGQSVTFIRTFISPSDMDHLQQLGAPAMNDVIRLKISLFQYARANTASPLQMLLFYFFDPTDPTFDFWSWLYVMEWAVGFREAISFQGDVGTVNVISEWVGSELQEVDVGELPTTFATYALGGVLYVTGVMLAISVLLFISILFSRGHVEGLNIFELNRVAGIVWVGRGMLFLRGITALCLLCTTTLHLELHNYAVNFYTREAPWYKTILGAGETGWIVYILNDIVMVWTREYSSWYCTGCGLLAWLVVAVLTLVQPVAHRATMDPQCQFDQVDFQVVCQSGVIYIGQSSRLFWVLGIIIICIAGSYIVVRIAKLAVHDEGDSLLLSSGAKYLFDRKPWIHHGVYYIDPASAILNGMITFHWKRKIYIMDIKTWRFFSIEADEGVPPSIYFSLPLTE
ncbi:Aste57867_23535 [Aphanomyces stellatus]|uniref:Aste57867_23535 protein n=1 Tax=Aphanomyces stellatus TaxID=120398 RepID=A0A485LN28_9STRA|nr:hypothetical protein As57867_023464 [Aphanomyces stellatus]VFU00180.1 Aste57867_23535 [Aphanomyces stellatus]